MHGVTSRKIIILVFTAVRTVLLWAYLRLNHHKHGKVVADSPILSRTPTDSIFDRTGLVPYSRLVNKRTRVHSDRSLVFVRDVPGHEAQVPLADCGFLFPNIPTYCTSTVL
jgi:hypothetical protein